MVIAHEASAVGSRLKEFSQEVNPTPGVTITSAPPYSYSSYVVSPELIDVMVPKQTSWSCLISQ
jgi:hypothetical protein